MSHYILGPILYVIYHASCILIEKKMPEIFFCFLKLDFSTKDHLSANYQIKKTKFLLQNHLDAKYHAGGLEE